MGEFSCFFVFCKNRFFGYFPVSSKAVILSTPLSPSAAHLEVPVSCNPARSPGVASCEIRTQQREIDIVSAMHSAMSESRGRALKHPRRARLFLARLPFLVLLVCVVIVMKHPVKAENEPEPPDDADEEAEVSLVISSCDDLPDERTEVFGIVRVVGDIICSENRVSNTSNSRYFLSW